MQTGLRRRTDRPAYVRPAAWPNGGQKKARLGSRADKGLEIFSVNEKVCFEKQKSQYSDLGTVDY
jgi:hypothetical protein